VSTYYAAAQSGPVVWTVDNLLGAAYDGTKGKIVLAGDWYSGGCLDVASFLTNKGRLYNDGAHVFFYDNATPTLIGQANLIPSGDDVLSIRWDSSEPLPSGGYAEVLRDGVPATWDTTPATTWSPGSPSTVTLSGSSETNCRADIRLAQIWNVP
jgi:hypothetical protein